MMMVNSSDEISDVTQRNIVNMAKNFKSNPVIDFSNNNQRQQSNNGNQRP